MAAIKTIPRITVPDIEETNMGISSNPSSSSPGSVDVAERNAFNAQIVQKLREAYQPVGGEDRTFFCRIEFTLSIEGRVASSRVLNSSGNRLFDKAVLEALARLRVSTPPQSLVGDPLTTTFQVEP
ncbi:MAG: TonB family protein [Nibricoccus sp.]